VKNVPVNFPESPVTKGIIAKFTTFLKVAPGRVCLAGEQKGFTLLELVVVLALLALMMGLVVPNMYGSWQRERDRAGLRQLLTTMRSARSIAATRHQRVRVFLDLGAGRYQLEGSSRQGDLSRFRLGEAHLVWQDREARRGYIAFYGDGTTSGGYLALVDRGGKAQIIDVEVITGKVSLRSAG
jgi:general secretion pathway protein H